MRPQLVNVIPYCISSKLILFVKAFLKHTDPKFKEINIKLRCFVADEQYYELNYFQQPHEYTVFSSELLLKIKYIYFYKEQKFNDIGNVYHEENRRYSITELLEYQSRNNAGQKVFFIPYIENY